MEIEISFHSIELGQATLGEAPEGFDSIDMDSMGGKMLAFVDSVQIFTEGSHPISWDGSHLISP